MRSPVAERLRVPLALGLVTVVMAIVIAFSVGRARTRIVIAPAPSEAVATLARETLHAAVRARPLPAASQAARAYAPPGPIVVIAWYSHTEFAREVVSGPLIAAVARAGRTLREHPYLEPLVAEGRVRFSIEIGLGEGPLTMASPRPFSLVPLVEGLHARVGARHAYVTPLELLADDAYQGTIPTGTPDFLLGIDFPAASARLVAALGRPLARHIEAGTITRVAFAHLAEAPYPSSERVSIAALRRAANEAGDFLIRFQDAEGVYTYMYDPLTGRMSDAGWNLARHAGTTYFMAQLARMTGRADARASALAGLGYITRTRLRTCGAPHRICVTNDDTAEVGPAALLAIACAELLRGGHDAAVERTLRGLTAFLRAQQRPDGELMHVFDRTRDRPVDVQYPYFSGEAALALVVAYDVLADARDLDVAKRLLRGIVETWRFPFSEYYYGEEHWTCIAAGEARASIIDPVLVDFCRGWLEYSDRLQYRRGETRWPIEGAYGVGPLFLPNLTPVGSRTEAFVATYQLLEARGEDTTLARAHVTRSLGALLRYRFAPGPVEVLSDPPTSRGAVPGNPSRLGVRNDYVQHAGSAWLRYVEAIEAR